MSSTIAAAIEPALPDGWCTVPLSQVARLESGHTPSKRHRHYWGGSVPWVSLHDTANLDGAQISETAKSITEEGLRHSSARLLPAGTVVFSRTATVGKSTVMARAMATSQDFANFVCGPNLHNRFLMYLFRSMRPVWQQMMAGSIHNTIYMPVFQALEIVLPPLSEQRAIAEALSEVDELLAGLRRLLAKKRDIKQAVMQQLLTGQTRLPGFSGDWEEIAFGDVFSRINVKRFQIQTAEYEASGKYPVVDQSDQLVSAFSDRQDRLFQCPPGGIVVFGDHTCVVKFVDFDFVVGADGTQVLQAHAGQSARFHAYQLQHLGIASTGYNRHFRLLTDRMFAAPSLWEQDAIAAVLSDMDAELDALEARRVKTLALKQAMMQELLTGRTRLV